MYRQLRRYAAVNWRAWGRETLDLARHQGKPLFLNSQYALCQFCDLLEEESFSGSEEIAALLNRDFVPVRIDKHLDPAVDLAFMMYLQLRSKGQGAWPLNAIVSPENGAPFATASYLRPDDMLSLLRSASEAWQHNRDLCDSLSTAAATDILKANAPPGLAEEINVDDIRVEAEAQFESLSSSAPRFPMGYALSVLGTEHSAATLNAIARGGIVDQLDGGVFTYALSTDWHLPTFEKTLSGQATLLMAAATELKRTSSASVEVLNLTRGLHACIQQLQGHSALVGSPATYLWTYSEFETALFSLGLIERDIAQMLLGVNENGNINADLDQSGALYGMNVLSLHAEPAEVGKAFGQPKEKVTSVLAEAVNLLREYRHENKPRPALSPEIDVGAIGLAIAGLSRAEAFVPGALETAHAAVTLLEETFAARPRTCVEYAYTIMGLLDLAEVDKPNPEWIERAVALQMEQMRLFSDPHGGFFATQEDPTLFMRPEYGHDSAEPNYNGISAQNLRRLEAIRPLPEWEAAANATISRYSGGLWASPLAYLSYLEAISS